MEDFMLSCVNSYCELAKIDRSSLPMVPTPFLVESWADDNVGGPSGASRDDAVNGLGDLLGFDTPSSKPTPPPSRKCASATTKKPTGVTDEPPPPMGKLQPIAAR
eukprot:10607843-Prorocentrum_lima.AAC.1